MCYILTRRRWYDTWHQVPGMIDEPRDTYVVFFPERGRRGVCLFRGWCCNILVVIVVYTIAAVEECGPSLKLPFWGSGASLPKACRTLYTAAVRDLSHLVSGSAYVRGIIKNLIEAGARQLLYTLYHTKLLFFSPSFFLSMS